MKSIFGLLALLTLVSCSSEIQKNEDFTQFVDPFIGTGGHGHTYPGASLPFGMVQLSPDTRLSGWDGCSAYHYSDSIIYGFSHTHLSGTGVSDYGDILLMPTTGLIQMDNGSVIGVENGYASYFQHKNEIAKPGYYSVFLDSYNIQAEFTTSKRVGMHKYTYPKGAKKNLIIDLSHRDEVIDSKISIINDYQIEGYRVSKAWAQEQHVYFVAQFSEKIALVEFYRNDSLIDQNQVEGENVKAAIRFVDKSRDEVMVKLALSAVDIEGARKNLHKKLKGWRFDFTKENAKQAWNKELGKIKVTSSDLSKKTIFYTSLYHSFLNPNLFMDVDGRYRGMDLKIHQDDHFENYTVFSLWDTYRATHPLFTITQQDRTRDFLNTFINQYKTGGILPIWELAGNYTGCMIGYHSIPVITDAFFKGIDGVDYEFLYEAMKQSAMQNHLGLLELREYGYIPADLEHESVSKTLEYAYDDWCIAQMAKKMGKMDDYAYFIERAQYYKNIYDPKTGFMTPKMNSNWIKSFDPREVNFHFTEANSWQYSFYVPQDVRGLIKLTGGDEAFSSKLDLLFQETSETTGRSQADITGLIGQYAHGNEPSHHMGYLYSYAGKPWKTQEIISRILNEMYTNKPDGLSGNEDCGQMSSWFNLSSIGFYPVNPADGIYVFGSPLFEQVQINLENGNQFTLRTTNLSKENIYIQKVLWNGNNYPYSYIKHADLMAGGELEFIMSSEPNMEFATNLQYRPESEIDEYLISPVPVIIAENRTFYDFAKIDIQSAESESKIYYTTDGSSPDENGIAYVKPFYIYASTEIRAIAVKEGFLKSKIAIAEFKRIPKGRSVIINSEYSNQYSAGGDNAIIDYLRGPNDFRTGFWQGYQGQNFEAIINLGKVQKVNTLAASFIQEIRSWIWFPPEVQFYTSLDGINFKLVGSVTCDIPDNDYEQQIKEYKVLLENEYARYVKVFAKYYGKNPSWHLGAGGDSWLFIDEIIVE